MYSITFKAKPQKDKNWVKIEMVLFQTGYNRVPKALEITGLAKDWVQKEQTFKENSVENIERNSDLLETKKKYLKVATEWEKEERAWSPIQWAHSFDSIRTSTAEESFSKVVRVLSVSKCVDEIIVELKNRKRIKNGKIITSAATARNYHYCKKSIEKFTEEVYGRKFSSYFFRDIDEKFIGDYVFYLQERGAKNGNKAGLSERLRQFYGIFFYSEKMGIADVNKEVFLPVNHLCKRFKKTKPKTVSYQIIDQIETIDRTVFTKLECFHIDLFLFSFYTGGMANVDVCYLSWNSIENDVIIYERTKFPKKARMPISEAAKDIIIKYKDKCYGEYVLPIFSHKHDTEKKQRCRLKKISEKVNKTLKKVASHLSIDENLTWYAARGTFITKMLNDGYHPIEVAEFAGNSPKTIYNSYWKQTNTSDIQKHLNSFMGKKRAE